MIMALEGGGVLMLREAGKVMSIIQINIINRINKLNTQIIIFYYNWLNIFHLANTHACAYLIKFYYFLSMWWRVNMRVCIQLRRRLGGAYTFCTKRTQWNENANIIIKYEMKHTQHTQFVQCLCLPSPPMCLDSKIILLVFV